MSGNRIVRQRNIKEALMTKIIELLGDVPRIELFARQKTEG